MLKTLKLRGRRWPVVLPAVVVKPGCVAEYASAAGVAVIEAEQPRLWFARAAKLLKTALAAGGVHPSAVVGADVELGADVTVGPCAVIGDGARIGAGTRIEAGASIGEGVRLASSAGFIRAPCCIRERRLQNRVVVHSGAVLGADGFGYVRDAKTGSVHAVSAAGHAVA